MATIGTGLQQYIAGQSNLPETAVGYKQKPVDDFGYKPTDAQTQRDIERDKKFSPIEREIFMEMYRKRIAQEGTRKAVVERKAPRMGIGLQRLLQDVKGAVTDPIERLGATTRKAVTSLKLEKQIPPDPFDVKANAAVPISIGDILPEYVTRKTGSELAGLAASIVSPSSIPKKVKMVGETIKKVIPEDWMGEKLASELGDITITRSAKFPDKVQVTYWEGKAGTSPTVGDEIFDSVEEAKAGIKGEVATQGVAQKMMKVNLPATIKELQADKLPQYNQIGYRLESLTGDLQREKEFIERIKKVGASPQTVARLKQGLVEIEEEMDDWLKLAANPRLTEDQINRLKDKIRDKYDLPF